jgi:3D (Asp-Asp-Asp) domain-containing protein
MVQERGRYMRLKKPTASKPFEARPESRPRWWRFLVGSLMTLSWQLVVFESIDLAEIASARTEAPENEKRPSFPYPSDMMDFEATAYCDYGITKSGVVVERGIVAADPRVLPLGTIIDVEAGEYSGIYRVLDTGGLVKGRIIDIYMPDECEALEFGRQQVRLRVIRYGFAPPTD